MVVAGETLMLPDPWEVRAVTSPMPGEMETVASGMARVHERVADSPGRRMLSLVVKVLTMSGVESISTRTKSTPIQLPPPAAL